MPYMGDLLPYIDDDGVVTCTERAVEYPFVFMNLDLEEGAKILDFGCAGSLLSYKLASLGYKVTGYDLDKLLINHPNFTFIQDNLMNNDFPDETFDGIIAVSAIEHCGSPDLEGGTDFIVDKDLEIVGEFHRLLKIGGVFIFTVPFGRSGFNSEWRCYDEANLNRILKNFSVEKMRFFRSNKRVNWKPATMDELKEVSGVSGQVESIVCVKCRKTSTGDDFE